MPVRPCEPLDVEQPVSAATWQSQAAEYAVEKSKEAVKDVADFTLEAVKLATTPPKETK